MIGFICVLQPFVFTKFFHECFHYTSQLFHDGFEKVFTIFYVVIRRLSRRFLRRFHQPRIHGPSCHVPSLHTLGGCAIVAADFDWTSLHDAMGESHRQAYPLIFSILGCFRCIDACLFVHVMSCVSCVTRRRSMEQELKSDIFAYCRLRPLWCSSFSFFALTFSFALVFCFRIR